MKTYYLYWRNGKKETIEAKDLPEHIYMDKELDFYAEDNKTQWFYNKRKRRFQILEP